MSELPPPRLGPEIESALADIFGGDGVSRTREDRAAYSRDLWPRAGLWARQGRVPHPPDFIVWATEERQIPRLLELARSEGFPLVPYGAGSGVCGAAIPVHGGVVLDMKRMGAILDVDETSLTVRAQAGIMGQNLELDLNRRGYTMGHFPSSIHCSTLGGYLATRAAGQLSGRYGKIEDMVLALRAVLADGSIFENRLAPKHATGPDLLQLLVGSEGTLGITTEAVMRIHPLPESRRFRGFMFPGVEAGLETIRLLLRRGARPAAVRLYDELDTFLVGKGEEERTPAGEVLHGLTQKVQYKMLAWPGVVSYFESLLKGRCLLVLTFEGDPGITRAEEEVALSVAGEQEGTDLGEAPGRYWWEHRYDVSYKQSPLLDEGYFVDTFEVATTWTNLARLYQSVRGALRDRVVVMAHFSHAYVDGCSIYFTFAGKGSTLEETEELYEAVWDRAISTALDCGATLSHHHGVGMSKQAGMERQLGKEGLEMLRRVKAALDPNNILNPGKIGLPGFAVPASGDRRPAI